MDKTEYKCKSCLFISKDPFHADIHQDTYPNHNIELKEKELKTIKCIKDLDSEAFAALMESNIECICDLCKT